MKFWLTQPGLVCFMLTIGFPAEVDQVLQLLVSFERDLCLSLQDVFESIDLKFIARRTSIPSVNGYLTLFTFASVNSHFLECRQVYWNGAWDVFFLYQGALPISEYCCLFLGTRVRAHSQWSFCTRGYVSHLRDMTSALIHPQRNAKFKILKPYLVLHRPAW